MSALRVLNRIDGSGTVDRHARVSVVLKLPTKDGDRYVLRQSYDPVVINGKEMKDRFYLGFPGSWQYTKENPEETAVRTARVYGFDVEARRHLLEEGATNGVVQHYVLCKNETSGLFESEMVFWDPQHQRERRVILMHPRDVIHSPYVKEDVRRVIHFWDWKNV